MCILWIIDAIKNAVHVGSCLASSSARGKEQMQREFKSTGSPCQHIFISSVPFSIGRHMYATNPGWITNAINVFYGEAKRELHMTNQITWGAK